MTLPSIGIMGKYLVIIGTLGRTLDRKYCENNRPMLNASKIKYNNFIFKNSL